MTVQAPPVKLAKLTPDPFHRTAGPVRVQAGDASAWPQAPRHSNRRSHRPPQDHDRHDRRVMPAVRSTHRTSIATRQFATAVVTPDRDTLPVAQPISVPFAANPNRHAPSGPNDREFAARIRIAPPPRSLALESGPRARQGLRGQKNGVIPARRAILIICDFRVLERSSRPGRPDELIEHRNQEQDDHA